MSKHTPGHWTVVIEQDHTNVEAPMFTVAADVTNEDAYLIAAAPEMLALLYKLTEADRPIDEYHREMIRKVIAKAEGRE